MEKTRKQCLQCGDYTHGRQDKKFCSDHCRASYYNQHHARSIQTIRKINSILARNRSILRQVSHAGYIFIPREQLLEWGFNFGHFTHIQQNIRAKQIYICYDKGYALDENGMVEIMEPDKTPADVIPLLKKPPSDLRVKRSARLKQ